MGVLDSIPEFEVTTELKQKLTEIRTRIQQREEQNTADRRECDAIQRQIHRLNIHALIDVEGGVRTRYRTDHPREKHLNDMRGTVTKVRRTHADVMFGETMWNFPIDHLMPDGGEQGYQFVIR